MPLEEPAWWYGPAGDPRVALLRPLSRLWAMASERRMSQPARYRSSVPVICIGNFTAGGTGKTPLSMLVAERLKSRGLSPVILTRGYGAKRSGPVFVETSRHSAADVGDEPMLLARSAPVLIAADRESGARLIEQHRPRFDVIVMDDGLQNPKLAKALSIAVVDGRRGIGNGEVIPAGPLRARLAFQLPYADAILLNHPAGRTDPDGGIWPGHLAWLRDHFSGPILQARVVPAGDAEALKAGPLLAFAGIANPQRFYDLLASLGARVVETRSFPDHHPFGDADAEALLRRASAIGAGLVTTEKDHVRLAGRSDVLAELAAKCRVLPIRLEPDAHDCARLDSLLAAATAAAPPCE